MQVFNVKSLLLPYCLGRCDLASHLPSKLPLIPSLIFLPFLQLIIQLLGGRYDNRDRNLQATHQRGGCGSSAFPAF